MGKFEWGEFADMHLTLCSCKIKKEALKDYVLGGRLLEQVDLADLGFLRTSFFYALRFYALRAWGAVGHVGPTLRRIQCQIEAADGGVEGKAVVEGLEIWFNRKKMLRGFFIS